jgi:lysine 2,3-aminomutase
MKAAGEETLRTASALVDAQLAGSERLAELEQIAARYAVAITPAVADLIDTMDPDDPIARQFVPDIRELDLGARGRAWRSDRRRCA